MTKKPRRKKTFAAQSRSLLREIETRTSRLYLLCDAVPDHAPPGVLHTAERLERLNEAVRSVLFAMQDLTDDCE